MARALFIAEKASVMRNVREIYQKHQHEFSDDIDFVAQSGHLLELQSPAEYDSAYEKWDIDLLPINPAKEGGWKYKVSSRTKDLYQNIKNAIKSGNYDYIIHAGDPDAEGELLVNIVLNQCHNTLPVKRYWSNATNESSVLEALKDLKDDKEDFFVNLNNSALVRQHADWLFGMNGSRAIASKIQVYGQKIAVGRVMTWVQTQIVNREDEINNFVPTTEYGVNSIFEKDGNSFTASLVDENNQKVFFAERAKAEEVIKSLTMNAKVVDFEKKTEKTQPPQLFKLATLQQEASKHGFTAEQTLEIIQSLYEKKFLTYPRTDCEYLNSADDITGILDSAAEVSDCAPFISDAKSHLSDYRSNKRYVNDAELAKHGHSAIVPTTEKPDLVHMSPEEQKIYIMVAKRLVASMLDPMVTNKAIATLDNNGNIFKGSGRVLVSPGFNALLKKSFSEDALPELTIGEMLSVKEHLVNEKTTKCPSRFTDGSLIATMENPSKYFTDEELAKRVKGMSIGTPATRAAIITKLVKDKYIARTKKGQLYPTEFGSYMIHNISHLVLCKTEMTGQWDEKLKDVRNGYVSPEETEIYMMEQVEDLIGEVKKMEVSRVAKKEETNIGPCVCGGNIMEGEKRYHCSSCKRWMPKILANAAFTSEEAIKLFHGETVEKTIRPKKMEFKKMIHLDPDADFPLQSTDVVETSNVICPKCGGEMVKSNNHISCDCGFSVGYNIATKELDDDTLNELFSTGHTSEPVQGFYSSKKKKHFPAKLKFENDQISFDFS